MYAFPPELTDSDQAAVVSEDLEDDAPANKEIKAQKSQSRSNSPNKLPSYIAPLS